MNLFRPNCLRRMTRALLIAALAAAPLLLPSPVRAQSDIPVGVVLPITGKEARPGQYQREGIELAIKQINDAGGIFVKSLNKKLPVREVFYDDGSESARSASLTERAMSSDNVVAVIGGYSTALGEAESVMPDRYKTPWITPGAAATSIFSRGYQYTFGTLSSIENLGLTTGQFLGWLVDQNKLKKGLKIALAVENTDHGVDYVAGIQKWIAEHPGYFTVVFNEKFDYPGATDFSGLLQKVKNSHADIFLSDAHLPDYLTMQRQYLQSGMYHQMISYGARGPEADARKAMGSGIDYIFAAIWWSKDLTYPQVKKFNTDYQAFTGHAPDSWYAATSYDAMRMLAQSIERAGKLDKTAIRDQLRSGELKNSILPTQVLKFGKTGQVSNPFVIVQNKPDGKVDIVFPQDAATGPPVAPKPQS
ncbi:MAG TPA: amino acid ABC transporter substrate-binding protein [Candidatus Binatia bacterium]|nr:amino acid ABC transporter substrate-binding protein [Candidatus Binatia bacterium]